MMEFVLNVLYPWLVGSCFAYLTKPRFMDSEWTIEVVICVVGSWIAFIVNMTFIHKKIRNVWKL